MKPYNNAESTYVTPLWSFIVAILVCGETGVTVEITQGKSDIMLDT